MAAVLLSSLLFALHFSSSLAGNTTCADNGMDYYTNLVGETPCRTYERLRQICNNQYQVGTMNVNTPPDFCDEQVADCCCNSVAFALSMMCLTCQQGFSQNPNGYDAGKGAYQMYLTADRSGFCSPNKNQSLPDDIQAAVCNQKIKIFDDLYSLFWGDGTWFYQFTAQTINRDINSKANNTFTHCDSTTIHSTSSSDDSTSAPSSTSVSGSGSGSSSDSGSGSGSGSDNSSSDNQSNSSLSGGAIAGIAVGALAVLGLFGALAWFWRKQKRSEQRTYTGQAIIDGGPDGSGSMHRSPTSASMGQVQPYPYPYSSVPSSQSSSVPYSQASNPFSYTTGSSGSQSQHQLSGSAPSQSGSSVTGTGSNSGSGSAGSVSGAGAGAAAIGAGAASVARSRSTRKAPLPPIPSGSAVNNSSNENQRGYGYNPYDAFQPPAAPGQTSPGLSLGDDYENQNWSTERHMDAGPVPESMLQRAPSGRLPPAYGEQFG
ncbi:hypothetical protein VKT23_012420 [Stygiomarasmius scandens]|uniref:Uncharacterized protein n=1 Tax=Marasmiellus scandens TaxID=2682957 RepID=A0ABR1JAZ5_9AGAR